jgi:cyclophilin family peptidyl-prolyl cis-trans isomerase
VGTTKRDRQKAGRQARIEAAEAARRRAQTVRLFRNLAILVVVVVAVSVVLWLRSDGDDGGDVTAGDGTTTSVADGEEGDDQASGFVYGSSVCPAEDGSATPTVEFTEPQPNCIDDGVTYKAVFDTSEGEVSVDLDTDRTPGTANNFVVLSRYHYYDGTQLFRTNTGIGIIQGGSPHTQSSADPGPGYNINDEGGEFDFSTGAGTGPFTYQAGDLVMARSSGPDAASAQFFFCVTDACSNLDTSGTYVTFGHVSEGLDVLEAILALHEDGASPGEGAPSKTVTVESVTIEES